MMTVEIFLLLFCLAGSAFFAGLETGIISINRLRLQHLVRRQVPGAKTVRHFLTHSDLLLGTTLIGTNLLQVVSAILAASVGRRVAGAAGAAARASRGPDGSRPRDRTLQPGSPVGCAN